MKCSLSLLRHSELPLKEYKYNLFLKISTGIAVFLFSVTLAAYFMISSVIQSWNKNIIDGLTVQIMPSKEVVTEDENLLRINKAIAYFEGLEGVRKVTLVSDQKIQELMSSWLGSNADLSALPVPQLLDVKLENGRTFDYEKAVEGLKEIAPYASIDNHGIWLKKLIKSAASLQVLSVFILGLVLTVVVCSLFYAVQTSLRVHQNIVEILHIMGATDDYIAKQYAFRAFWIALFSGFIGTVIAFFVLMTISHLSSDLEAGLIRAASLSFGNRLFLMTMPLWSAVLSMIMTFGCVKKTLGKLM